MQTARDLSKIQIVVEGDVSHTTRARQVSSMFDAPPEKKCRLEYNLDLSEIESAPWNVGLVVGPSGSGKTTVMRHLWGEPRSLEWHGAGVVDDISPTSKLDEIAAVCQAVGFNTIPAWMRPFSVLSNGEKFRAELARRLLEDGDLIVVDEFTSVVDRQVAAIGSHAVQKYVRKAGKQFVAVGCHYDVIDWLQPDWVLDMATRQLTRRLLRRRPELECTIGRLPRSAWSLFSPYHYMSASLHNAAQCFGLWVGNALAAFAAVMFRPVSRGSGPALYGVSRLVTLPDYQGLGLAFVLVDALGAEYSAQGKNLHTYPGHPSLIRGFDRSDKWEMRKRPGTPGSNKLSGTSQLAAMGESNCAVFRYVGPMSESPVFA